MTRPLPIPELLTECDWVMNESPDRKLFLAGKHMVGKQTRMIQNVVGWAEHNAKEFLSDPQNRNLDLYGFAEPRKTPCHFPSRHIWASRWRHSPAQTVERQRPEHRRLGEIL